jgi:hypothetical protein
MMRSRLALTDAEVNDWPSWNRTPRRSVKRHVSGSRTSQRVASIGWRLPSGPTVTRESNMVIEIDQLPMLRDNGGSRVSMARAMATVSVPLGAAPASPGPSMLSANSRLKTRRTGAHRPVLM